MLETNSIPWRSNCEEAKERRRNYNRQWVAKNKEKCAAAGRKSYEKHKGRVKERSAAWRKANPERFNAAKRKWRKNNPDLVQAQNKRDDDRRIFKTYGITRAQKAALLASQGNVCAICSTDTPAGRGWHVDHDHETKQVRRILCHHCNTGLGHFKDNPALLRAAAAYLERFKNGGQEQETAG